MSTRLFTPFSLRDVQLRNRIVVSPMWQYAGDNGAPTDTHLVHLGRLAEGGAALVFQEGTSVDRRARGTTGDLGLWDDALVPAFARLVQVIKGAGAVPGIQLIHAGRKARRNPPWDHGEPLPAASADWRVLGPSAIPMDVPDAIVPEEMTLAEVEQTVQDWVDAARRADEAGYEVLDLQAAHGYLLHSFLSPLSNQRTDRYGGSTGNRRRLLLEIVDGIRRVWSESKPLFVRLSIVDAGWSVEDSVELVRVLLRHGVDVIDCSTGGLTGTGFDGAPALGYGYQTPYSAAVRRQTGTPTVAVGHIVHPEHAERIIADGEADLVAIGRELLHHPNWPLDAARRLGHPDAYALAPTRIAHWLRRRESAFEGFTTSTDGAASSRGAR